MITLNGCSFAESTTEALSALIAGSPAYGIAKRRKRQIDLFDSAHKPVAAIGANGVLARCTVLDDGRIWYSYGDPDGIGAHASPSKRQEEIEALAVGRDKLGMIFA